MNEKVEGWFGRPADKLLMGGGIKLTKGHMWRIILEKILPKIHVYGGWYMNMKVKDKQRGMGGKSFLPNDGKL